MVQQSMRITDEEQGKRCRALLQASQKLNLAGIVLFDAVNIYYFTGFAFIPTERPIAFVLAPDGEPRHAGAAPGTRACHARDGHRRYRPLR
jgi:Xaa-Pro aminopeptidase